MIIDDEKIKQRIANLDQSKVQKLDHLAWLVILCFLEANLDDVYIESKINRFLKKSEFPTKFHTLQWAVQNLDSENLSRFAEHTNLSIEELRVTAKVFSHI